MTSYTQDIINALKDALKFYDQTFDAFELVSDIQSIIDDYDGE